MTHNLPAIVDSTLREGEQTAGVTFDDTTRRMIIRYLYQVGVDEIELGIASPVNTYLPKLVRDTCRITHAACAAGLWCRCLEEDIAFAALCRPDVLSLSIPVSDLHIHERLGKNRTWIRERVARAIDHALSLQIPRVSVGFEDASRADPHFLLSLAQLAENCGASRIRLADTVGICSPENIRKLIRPLKDSVKTAIGIHCHNDFGMATANSIAALESGASWLDATVLGLGERAGNCRLEEVVGYLSLIRQDSRYQPKSLTPLCNYVAQAAGREIAASHPIIGKDIFTCETGLHQHGLAVQPITYEPYDPGLVGTKRVILFGRKTGRKAISLALAGTGIFLSAIQLNCLTERVRAAGTELNMEQLRLLATALFNEKWHGSPPTRG